MDFCTNFQMMTAGLAMGSIYALVALGFVLIFNAVNVVNFAQGEFVMVPAFVAVWLMIVSEDPVSPSHTCSPSSSWRSSESSSSGLPTIPCATEAFCR